MNHNDPSATTKPSRISLTPEQLASLNNITSHTSSASSAPPSLSQTIEAKRTIQQQYQKAIAHASTPDEKKKVELEAATAYLILWLTAVNISGETITQYNYLDALYKVVASGSTPEWHKFQLALQHYQTAYVYDQATKGTDYFYSPTMGAVFHCQFNQLRNNDPKLKDNGTLGALHQAAECYLAFTNTPLAQSGIPLLFEALLTSAMKNNTTSKLQVTSAYLACQEDKVKTNAELQHTLKLHCLFVANNTIEIKQIRQLFKCIEHLKRLALIDDDYQIKLMFLCQKRRYELQDSYKAKELVKLFEFGYKYISNTRSENSTEDFNFLITVYDELDSHESLTAEQKNTIRYYFSMLCLSQKHDIVAAKLTLTEVYLDPSYTEEEEEDKEDYTRIATDYCQQLLGSLKTADDYQRLVLCLETLQRDEPSANYADNIFTCHLKIYQLGTPTVASLTSLFCAAYHAYLRHPLTSIDPFVLDPNIAFETMTQLTVHHNAHIHQQDAWQQLLLAYNKFTSLPATHDNAEITRKTHYVFALLCLLRNKDQATDSYLSQAHSCLANASKQREPELLYNLAITILTDTQQTHATTLLELFSRAIELAYISDLQIRDTEQKAEIAYILTQVTTIKSALTAPKRVSSVPPLPSLPSTAAPSPLRKSQIPLPTARRSSLNTTATPAHSPLPARSASASTIKRVSFWKSGQQESLTRVATSPEPTDKKQHPFEKPKPLTRLVISSGPRDKPTRMNRNSIDRPMPAGWTPRTWDQTHHRKATTASLSRTNIAASTPLPTKSPK